MKPDELETKTTKPKRRSKRRAVGRALLGVGLLMGVAGSTLTSEVGEVVVISRPVADDLYVAASTVDVRADVDGDLITAGELVMVDSRITGDVMAAGQSLVLGGDFRDDVRVAGRTVTLTGGVGDHLLAAGQSVTLAEGAHVTGYAWIAGSDVDVAGEVDGDVKAAGQTVTITGTVGGDVELDATTAVIGDGAHIRGDLSWRSGSEPEIQPGARIDGRQIERPYTGPTVDEGDVATAIVASIVFGALSLLLLTWVLRAGMPPLMRGASLLLRERPGRSLGFGLLALIAAPIVAFIAFVTMVGAPLGVVILLGYVTLLVISAPVVLEAITDAVLERRRRPTERPSTWPWIGVLALASLLFVAATQIPFVGWLLGVVVIVMGLGALVLRAFRRRPMPVGPAGGVAPGPGPAPGSGGSTPPPATGSTTRVV